MRCRGWQRPCHVKCAEMTRYRPGGSRSAALNWRRTFAGCATRRCDLVMSESRSRLHTSLRCLRKGIWTVQIIRTTVPSLTCQLLERVILRRLLGHLTRNYMLSHVKSAYRKNVTRRSLQWQECCLTFWLHLIERHLPYWTCQRRRTRSTTAYYCVVCMSLTTSAVGAALSWISSYVTGQRQCVVHSGSQYDNIAFGMPQGPVLAPLLFVLYTADLCRWCRNTVHTISTRRHTGV